MTCKVDVFLRIACTLSRHMPGTAGVMKNVTGAFVASTFKDLSAACLLKDIIITAPQVAATGLTSQHFQWCDRSLRFPAEDLIVCTLMALHDCEPEYRSAGMASHHVDDIGLEHIKGIGMLPGAKRAIEFGHIPSIVMKSGQAQARV